MKKLIMVIVLMTLVTASFGEDVQLLYQQAGTDYKTKNFDKAAKTYEKILELGFESADLYFNLGNTYFKLNDLPMAIWYYEKARKLAPGDDDILFNLRLANTKTLDKIESVPVLFFHRWWSSIRSWYSPDGWAKITIGLFSLFFFMTAMYLLMKKILIRVLSFWMALILLSVSALAFVYAWQTWQLKQNQKEAIIFSAAINIKSSPDESSVDIFVLHEGTKVVITDNLGEWYKILIANGSVGWVKAEAMKII